MNVTLFLSALDHFRTELDASNASVRSAYADLEEAHHALRASWDGDGAQEFLTAWRRAGDVIGAYTEGVPPLVALLEEKIAALRALDGAVAG